MLGKGEPERGQQKDRDSRDDRAPDADPVQDRPHRRRAAGHGQSLRSGEPPMSSSRKTSSRR